MSLNKHTFISAAIAQEIITHRDEEQRKILMRFFRTGPGEYGEGDMFHGVKVPITRKIVYNHRMNATIPDTCPLIESPWHEERLGGFLLLIEIYSRHKKLRDEMAMKHIIDFYLDHLKFGNNWDLTDIIAPKLLGDWLISHPEDSKILDRLSDSTNLWEQRVSIVSTLSMIRHGIYRDTIVLSEKLLYHPHDLMHKAVGWMLREVGKKDISLLTDFLDRYAATMPRTTLRYAIERMTPEQKTTYMSMGKKKTKHQQQ